MPSIPHECLCVAWIKLRIAVEEEGTLILCIVLCLLGVERLPQGAKGSGEREEPGVARQLGGNIVSISWRTLMASVMLTFVSASSAI